MALAIIRAFWETTRAERGIFPCQHRRGTQARCGFINAFLAKLVALSFTFTYMFLLPVSGMLRRLGCEVVVTILLFL